MTPSELKRILRAFVSEPSDLEVRQGRIVAQIHDELVDVLLESKPDTGELVVVDGDTRFAARTWLLRRVAKIDLLAERILAYAPKTEAFVEPSGSLRGDLSTSIEDDDLCVSSAVDCLEKRVVSPLIATTSVLYLTSDAGEGKTTLINQVARRLAERCKARQQSILLLPIPLGGKTFLRFDDVVIGTLSNRFRFNRYYFDGFLELVRLGALVPAFDGFEEMFVEGHSGEAVSALGTLIESLDSSGSLIVAARKAFFEFTSFRTQAKLFDSIGDRSASFARLKIDRWMKPQFLQYAQLRGFTKGEALYELFCSRLSSEHPMLSRAFLVKRLFDLAEEVDTVEQLVASLGTAPQDYFFKFVEAIVDREARLKWLDKSGDASHPLMTLDEHHELLASIAREMWQSSANALRLDIVDVIVDLFAETKGRGASFARQVRERIKNHSLLALDPSRGSLLEFDHDEFRRFYLGESLGRSLADHQTADLLSIVSADALPADTCDQALNYLNRRSPSREAAIRMLLEVARTASPLSYAGENCGALLARLLASGTERPEMIMIDSITFPAESLAGRSFENIQFKRCHFEPTSLVGTSFSGVEFLNCEFERLESVSGNPLTGTIFAECRVNEFRLDPSEGDRSLYGPTEISKALENHGAMVRSDKASPPNASEISGDSRVELVERFLRVFLRSTQVNEDIVKARFGRLGSTFFDNVLPALIKGGVVQTVDYRGRGVQERYKLSVPMQSIQDALQRSGGDFGKFLDEIAE